MVPRSKIRYSINATIIVFLQKINNKKSINMNQVDKSMKVMTRMISSALMVCFFAFLFVSCKSQTKQTVEELIGTWRSDNYEIIISPGHAIKMSNGIEISGDWAWIHYKYGILPDTLDSGIRYKINGRDIELLPDPPITYKDENGVYKYTFMPIHLSEDHCLYIRTGEKYIKTIS